MIEVHKNRIGHHDGKAHAGPRAESKTATSGGEPGEATATTATADAFADQLQRAQGDASTADTPVPGATGKAKAQPATKAQPAAALSADAAALLGAPTPPPDGEPASVTEAAVAASTVVAAGGIPAAADNGVATLPAPMAASAPKTEKTEKTAKGKPVPAADRKAALASDKPTARPSAQPSEADGQTETSRPSLHAAAGLADVHIVIAPDKVQPPGLTAAAAGMAGKGAGADTPTLPGVQDPADASDAVTKLRLGSQTKAAAARATSTGSDGSETPPIFGPGGTELSDRVDSAAPAPTTATAGRASALDVPDPVDPAATPGQHRADITIGEGDRRIVVSVLATEHQVRVHARAATGDDTAAMRAGADELRGALRKHGLELAYLGAETRGGGSAATERGPDRGPEPDSQDNRKASQERRTTENQDPPESPRSDVRILA